MRYVRIYSLIALTACSQEPPPQQARQERGVSSSARQSKRVKPELPKPPDLEPGDANPTEKPEGGSEGDEARNLVTEEQDIPAQWLVDGGAQKAHVRDVPHHNDPTRLYGRVVTPLADPPLPALVLLAGRHGLSEEFLEHQLRYAGQGYQTLSVSLIAKPEEATTPSATESHIRERSLGEVLADISGAMNYLRTQEAAGSVSIVGYDIAGTLAIEAMLAKVNAVVFISIEGSPSKFGAITTLERPTLHIIGARNPDLDPEEMIEILEEHGESDPALTVAMIEHAPASFMEPAQPLAASEGLRSQGFAEMWDYLAEHMSEE